MTVEERFAAVIATLRRDPSITEAKMFGARGLGIGGKYFAMLYKGQLVVKLPNERIQTLVASRHAVFFDPGMGRLMKEWAAVSPEAKVTWLDLAKEARDFVAAADAAGRGKTPRRKTAGRKAPTHKAAGRKARG